MASAGGVVIGLSPIAGIVAAAVTLAALVLSRNTGRAGGAGYVGGFLIVSLPTTAWATIAGATLMASMVVSRAAYLQMLNRRRGAG